MRINPSRTPFDILAYNLLGHCQSGGWRFTQVETDLPSRRRTTSISFMRELRSDTLIVFLSDRHIGGDPGCDAFEAADELQELFDELAEREEHEGPVELVLAGDFFDLLQVGSSREGLDRAGETVMRPEYQSLFAALRRFNEFEGHRTIYIPGNHDAEIFWNPRVRQTLMSKGLVSEFAHCYAASLVPEQTSDGESKVRPRAVYCEHGNQFDPANVVSDYTDPLDTPLGHHLVTDFTRRIAPVGRLTGELDLSDLKRVYPLVEIPRWIASRLFYDLMSRVLRYLLLPLLIAYAAYRGLAYYLASRAGSPATLWGSFPSLPEVQELFLDIYFFAILAVIVLGVFFIAAGTLRLRWLLQPGQYHGFWRWPCGTHPGSRGGERTWHRRATDGRRRYPLAARRIRLRPHPYPFAGETEATGRRRGSNC